MDSRTRPYGYHAPSRAVARLIGWTRAMPDTWLGHRTALWLRRRALALIRVPVDHEVFGARFRLNPLDNVCEKRMLFTPQFFDRQEREILVSRARACRGEFVFVDIGANAGGYSLALAQAVGPRARIVAIEPEPELFERLCENIRQNPGIAVKAINCAVADRDGDVVLFIDCANRAASSICMNGGVEPGEQINVSARMLASIIAEECGGRVDAMKVDVDGSEDISLVPYLANGADADLPDLLIVNRSREAWHDDIRQILGKRGYRELAVTSQNIVFTRD